jgi:putative DNA primase/helicase
MRHRWNKLAVHQYECTRCGMRRENRIREDGSGWDQVFTPAGGEPFLSPRVPPCDGAAAADAAAPGGADGLDPLAALAAAGFEAMDDGRGEPPPEGTIRLVAGELPRVVDEAEAALLRMGGLYQHGTRAVRVASHRLTPADVARLGADAAKAESKGGKDALPFRRRQGAPVLIEAETDWLVEQMCRAARWEQWDARAEGWLRKDAPRRVAQTYLARKDWRLPLLTGFIEAPTLAPDGRLIDRPGYDAETGLYLTGDLRLPSVRIPGTKRRDFVVRCLMPLVELTKSFPFASEADMSAALAMILTSLVRRLLPSAPIFGISASTPGTGKSLLANVCAVIATGREASAMGVGGDEIELEKRIDSALMDADSLILLDNISRSVRSDVLCQVTTQPFKTARVLRESRKVESPTNVTWIATGNNLTMLGDLARRTVMINLDAGCEKPEEREFGFDALDRALEMRSNVVCAALALVRAYLAEGSPRVEARRYGGFEAWDRVVRRPLMWAGMLDPLLPSSDLREQDHSFAAMRDLLAACWDRYRGEAVTAQQIVADAAEREQAFAGGRRSVAPELADAVTIVTGGARPGEEALKLGYKLRSARDRWHGAADGSAKYRILKADQRTRSGVWWRVEQQTTAV